MLIIIQSDIEKLEQLNQLVKQDVENLPNIYDSSESPTIKQAILIAKKYGLPEFEASAGVMNWVINQGKWVLYVNKLKKSIGVIDEKINTLLVIAKANQQSNGKNKSKDNKKILEKITKLELPPKTSALFPDLQILEDKIRQDCDLIDNYEKLEELKIKIAEIIRKSQDVSDKNTLASNKISQELINFTEKAVAGIGKECKELVDFIEKEKLKEFIDKDSKLKQQLEQMEDLNVQLIRIQNEQEKLLQDNKIKQDKTKLEDKITRIKQLIAEVVSSDTPSEKKIKEFKNDINKIKQEAETLRVLIDQKGSNESIDKSIDDLIEQENKLNEKLKKIADQQEKLLHNKEMEQNKIVTDMISFIEKFNKNIEAIKKAIENNSKAAPFSFAHDEQLSLAAKTLVDDFNKINTFIKKNSIPPTSLENIEALKKLAVSFNGIIDKPNTADEMAKNYARLDSKKYVNELDRLRNYIIHSGVGDLKENFKSYVDEKLKEICKLRDFCEMEKITEKMALYNEIEKSVKEIPELINVIKKFKKLIDIDIPAAEINETKIMTKPEETMTAFEDFSNAFKALKIASNSSCANMYNKIGERFIALNICIINRLNQEISENKEELKKIKLFLESNVLSGDANTLNVINARKNSQEALSRIEKISQNIVKIENYIAGVDDYANRRIAPEIKTIKKEKEELDAITASTKQQCISSNINITSAYLHRVISSIDSYQNGLGKFLQKIDNVFKFFKIKTNFSKFDEYNNMKEKIKSTLQQPQDLEKEDTLLEEIKQTADSYRAFKT